MAYPKVLLTPYFVWSFQQADIEDVKDAVGSAVDVMQAMASSICSLLSKVHAPSSSDLISFF